MDLKETMQKRHSVRSYNEQKIEGEVKNELLEFIEQCNKESGLNMQLILDEPKAFDNLMAHYGKFSRCKNYIALVGKKGADEKCGYYGEKLVLKAQQLGLNSCWVAMTYSKSKTPCIINKGEKLHIVIALGYGKTQGIPHKSKAMTQLCNADGKIPEWFENGMKAAMLEPTAMNQQKFIISLKGNKVSAKALFGFYTKIDLGIVKCHFEIGAGDANFSWI